MHSDIDKQEFPKMNFDTVKNHFCSIGMKKTKLRMNKYALIEERARILRRMLDVSYATISAKTFTGDAKMKLTNRKISFLQNLVYECREKDLTFGKAYDIKDIEGNNILYVEFQGMQFSWDIENEFFNLPLYRGIRNHSYSSNLGKLEYLILQLYPAINTDNWQPQKLQI